VRGACGSIGQSRPISAVAQSGEPCADNTGHSAERARMFSVAHVEVMSTMIGFRLGAASARLCSSSAAGSDLRRPSRCRVRDRGVPAGSPMGADGHTLSRVLGMFGWYVYHSRRRVYDPSGHSKTIVCFRYDLGNNERARILLSLFDASH